MFSVAHKFYRAIAFFGKRRSLKRCTAVFLPGDSYPTDAYIDKALEQNLSTLFAKYRNYPTLLRAHNSGAPAKSIDERLELLDRELSNPQDYSNAVLIGRSSGARVSTLFASTHPVRAVICLGYPFQFPGREPEPSRFEHLAALSVPTLILQGKTDAYGTAERAASYPLSSQIKLAAVGTDHEFKLKQDDWKKTCAKIERFLLSV